MLVIIMATGFGVTFMLAHEKRTATCFFLWTITMIAFYITPDLFGNGSVPIKNFLAFLDLLVYWLLLGKVPLDPFGDIRRHHLWLEAEKSKIIRAKKKLNKRRRKRKKDGLVLEVQRKNMKQLKEFEL